MKFLIIVNKEKSNSEKFAGEVIEVIKSHKSDYVFLDNNEPSDKFDIAILIGGDGTVLTNSIYLAKHKLPVFMINTGGLGFLANINKIEDIKESINRLVNKNYDIEYRTMLLGEVIRSGEKIAENSAINDIVFRPQNSTKTLKISVEVNGEYISKYVADGFIISTPTGSTAYNLSAMGAIVEPNSEVFSIIPICAHSFNNRSIIFNDNKSVTISVDSDKQILSFDGNRIIELQKGDKIVIKKSKDTLNFISFDKNNFFKNLKEKIRTI